MSDSYPRRDQARGIWKINDITKNIKEDGTYPQAGTNSTALVAGGNTPSASNNVDQFNMITSGNASDFGDLSVGRRHTSGVSNSTRGIFLGGITPSVSNTIDFVTIASVGDATDFGDLTQARFGIMDSVVSNSITGIFGSGRTPSNQDTIDKITIASAGDATDFGDLNETTNNVCGA